jgi:uncharacterized protein YaaW (UPF0174 family)/putative component of toxin-antitoxin plasmid stabilization module
MASDPIFRTLTPEVLDQIAKYLNWDPLVLKSPARLLSQCDSKERLTKLGSQRAELERYISWVGTPIFSYALGNAKSYDQIVADVAEQVGVPASPSISTAEIESKLLQKLWKDTLSGLSFEQREELQAKVEAAAAQYGTSVKKEMVGFAGLAAAQMSGFGVYVMGSTLLGALNSALGMGLGFGAFTGLSSAISIMIGPVGWAAIGLYTLKKLGVPNYKKLLPVVILIASQRGGGAAAAPSSASRPSSPSAVPTVVVEPPKPISPELTLQIHVRRYSKAEKTTFQLRPENRALCQIAKEFFPGTYFLDLSDNDRQAIREIKEEREQAEAKEKRAAEQHSIDDRKEARKERKREQTAARAAKKQDRKAEAALAKLTKDYSRLLRNLEFDPEAVERLERLAKAGANAQIDEKLGLMNIGQVVYRHSISDTDPPVYEAKAGYDYRIYYDRNGSKLRIRLVGDKGTQDADIAQLRRTPGRVAHNLIRDG